MLVPGMGRPGQRVGDAGSSERRGGGLGPVRAECHRAPSREWTVTLCAKVREILRLHHECHLTQRQVSASTGVSKGTVSDYLRRAHEAGLTWAQAREMDGTVEARLFRLVGRSEPPRRVPIDFSWVHQELRRTGVTLQQLWIEYREAAVSGPASGVGDSVARSGTVPTSGGRIAASPAATRAASGQAEPPATSTAATSSVSPNAETTNPLCHDRARRRRR